MVLIWDVDILSHLSRNFLAPEIHLRKIQVDEFWVEETESRESTNNNCMFGNQVWPFWFKEFEFSPKKTYRQLPATIFFCMRFCI